MESLYLKNNQLEGSYVTKKHQINSLFAIFRTTAHMRNEEMIAGRKTKANV